MFFGVFETSGFLLAYTFYTDPASVPDEDYPQTYIIFKYIVFFVSGVIFIYLSILSYFILKNWRTRLARHKTFFLFSINFTIIMAVLIYTNSFSFYSLSGIKTLLMIVLSNTYVYLLLFLYSISSSGKRELATIQKQNEMAERKYDYLEDNCNFEIDISDEEEDQNNNIDKGQNKINENKNEINPSKSKFENNFEAANYKAQQKEFAKKQLKEEINEQQDNSLDLRKKPETPLTFFSTPEQIKGDKPDKKEFAKPNILDENKFDPYGISEDSDSTPE